MRQSKEIKTTIDQIVEHWSQRILDGKITVCIDEAYTCCWRCGSERKLQRCHIVPASRGGKDDPSNLVLLCEDCHKEGPNVDDPKIMWDWLMAYKMPFLDMFRSYQGLREYEFIYKKTVEQELRDIFNRLGSEVNENVFEDLKRNAEAAFAKTSTHFGQPYGNAATTAGIYRMALKSLAAEYGVDFPIMDGYD